MELALHNSDGAESKLEVAEGAFGVDYNEALVHQVVTAYMAGGRAGTRASKTRAEVRGGGAKPWRQKGTGRARAGSIRSPIWRSGGVTFAHSPADHSQKVNRKMYRGAMRAILSELLRQERLVVVDSLVIESPKTQLLLTRLKNLALEDVLVVTAETDENLALAARNLAKVSVADSSHLSPVDLLRFEKVLMSADAVKALEGRLL